MSKLSTSPDRNKFQKERYLERRAKQGRTADNDPTVQAMAEYFDQFDAKAQEQEADPDWQKDNLEYDLRTSEWMVAKVRASEAYAQNLYAAMCNREFQKIDVMPILRDQRWSCSWRYAGGIVAHMDGKGDYIDWYCSGIVGSDPSDLDGLSETDRARIIWINDHFVSEGTVTDEIARDLKQLGWCVLDIDVQP